MGSTLEIPYWQTNIPISQRTETCPPYLANLNPKDISILSTPDASYHILSWPEVRAIIAANRLDVFQRMPSELRRYLHYIFNLKRDYSSVMNFVLSQRLHWTEPVEAVGSRPFEEEADVKVLCNDWPYGIDGRIVHLVVWTKFVLEDDEATGDLTEEARGLIEGFVGKRFRDRVGRENVSLSLSFGSDLILICHVCVLFVCLFVYI